MRVLTALEDAAGRNALDGLVSAAVPPEDDGLLDALARTEPLHPYTQSLLTVSPEVGRRRTHEVLTGEPPDPAHIPTGCRFHPAVRSCARERQAPKNPAAWERYRLSRSRYPAIEQPATWPRPEASELPDPVP
jgi:oligopeptide/dipeptide ABC transporter ATP-binding protein